MITVPQTFTQRPHGTDPCEVISVLLSGDEQWMDYRGKRLGTWLRARGIAHGWCYTADAAWLAEEARLRGARVILSEAQSVPCAVVAQLAAICPHLRIVHLLHGSPAWCASAAPAQTYGAARQARDIPNVYVGTVSDPGKMAWPRFSKIVHLPNPIEIPPDLTEWSPPPPPRRGQPLCISLIARGGAVKNWGGMLAAIGILATRRPLRVVISGRAEATHQEHVAYLSDLKIPAECMEFGDWGLTLYRVASSVHVGLACGFADALNLIAAEHCLLGIPVVGSPSLDWLPPSWQINPQDPAAIAQLCERHAAKHRRAGQLGRKIVRSMARRHEETLTRNIATLIDVAG